jgi:Hint module
VLRVTSGHFLYVNGDLAAAGNIVVGDTVALGRRGLDVITHVSTVWSRGLYNPQTIHGDVVVDGVCASTYTTAVSPAFAHAVLAPALATYQLIGWATSALDDGSPVAGLFAIESIV